MGMRKRLRLALGVAMIAIAASLSGAIWAQTKPTEPTGDLAFGRAIALIRGHLIAGEELVKLHQWNVAYPHFTFPTEEIYGVIRDELRSYHTPQFDGALKALARAVRSRSVKQYPKALEKVEAALAAADAGLKARQPDWPQFTLGVAVEVLKTAADEYGDAIENGRIAHPVGYRTTRGFILQADRMIESASAELPADPAALTAIRANMTKIKLAFADPAAPGRPVLDEKMFDDVVAQIASAFEKLAAGRQI